MSAARAEVRFDKYAIFDMSRHLDLTSPEQHLLWYLTIQADWRTAEWSGTHLDITGETRLGRHQVPKHLRRLIELGAVDEVVPFRRGAEGRVFVAVYDELVAIPTGPSRSKQITRRRTLDPEWRTHGLRMDSVWPDQSMPDGADLGERAPVRNKATKEEGTETCTAHNLECCFICPSDALKSEFAAFEVEDDSRVLS